MKDWVKEKLDKIDNYFPKERLDKSKERWTKIWNGEKPDDRYPFVYTPGFADYYAATPYDNYDQWLAKYLDDIIARGNVVDDLIPSIPSGCKQSIMPSLFGAKEECRGDDYACERILHEIEDIDNFPDPEIKPGTPAYNVLKLQEYLLEETEGRIPIHVVDMQGPGDACGKMWGYDNLFICAYEDPDRYHKLMTKVTDGFFMLWDRQKELLGKNFVGTHLLAWDWVPESAGASCSVDSLVMLSPSFYDEFYAPYISKIGKTYGGVTIHSCGYFSGVVKNICNTPYLKGLNASQMQIDQLIESGITSDIVISGLPNLEDSKKTYDLVKKHNLKTQLSFMGLWLYDEVIWGPKLYESMSEDEKKEWTRKQEEILEAVKI